MAENRDDSIIDWHKLVKESRKAIYQRGITTEGVHHDLFVFIQGPTSIEVKPADCTSEKVTFPGRYHTVHISYDKDASPVNHTKKYYCKSYHSADVLARRIADDKGIEIQDFADDPNDSVDPWLGYGRTYSQYHGGPTGDLSDDFINDFLDGDPDAYWNID